MNPELFNATWVGLGGTPQAALGPGKSSKGNYGENLAQGLT